MNEIDQENVLNTSLVLLPQGETDQLLNTKIKQMKVQWE